MAEIDNLSIQISANADSAEKSINSLIGSLRKLNQNLALGNVSTFARQMREITNSANGLKEVSSTISSIATAGRKLGDLSGYKTLNDQIRETESETKKLAKSIAESFDFKENGTEKAKQNIKGLTELIGVMFDKLGNGKNISQEADIFASMLPSMQGFKNVLDEDYQAIKNFADEYKVFVNAMQKGDLEHLFGSLKEASQITGIKFVDNQELAKFKDLEEYLGRIKELVGIDFMKGAANPIEGVKNLQHYFEEYAKSAEQATQASMPDASFYKAEGEKLARTVEDIYNRIYNESKVKNPFEGIVEGLKSLQGLTLPKMDGLSQLANDLERISKVDANGISKIVSAVNKFKGSDGNPAAGMAEAVERVAKAYQEMNTSSSAVDVTGSYREISSITEEITDEIEDTAQETLNLNKFALATAGSFADTAKWAAYLANNLERVKLNTTPMGNFVDNVNIGEINRMSQGIEDFTDKVEKAEQKAQSAAQSISEIPKALSGTAPMDGFSRMMHDVLLDIEKYSSIISNMKQRPAFFDAKGFEESTRKLKEVKDAWETFERTTNRNTRLGITQGMSEASKEAQRLQERIHDLKRMMNDMDNEKTIVNVEQYKAWAKELDKIQARYDELMGKKKEAEKSGGNLNLLANLVALGHEIGNIANAFDKLANYGIKGLRLAFKPLDHVIKEYKEKIKSIGDAFKGFTDRAKKELNKLSAFWKRSMKTFTFMLVRKAITAVITEVSDAVKSLALWSKQFGTIFNDSMSHITSNLSYIARLIVGAFEPIINAIVPAFNALSDAIARAAAKLGEFFAAMTGQGYYMAAKRQVTDYAESVDKANKAQKNLIAGLDDLNVITTPTSTENGMDDLAAQWEKVDVSDTMKDWAQTIKDLAKRLFDPIKKAWDATKDHVIDGWKYMTGEIKKLLKDIGRDFLKVWEQPATQKIFENIFNTIGNIEEAVGHLARNFREAWNYNDTGLHILENIRDIILNISGHVLNMSEAFKKWADELDFKPLLTAFEEFTRKVQPLIDFLGNLMEEVWQRVILAHWKFLVEKGIPHLLEAIGNVIDAFNFDKILEDIKPVLDAFERLRENLETGIVDAFENLGKAVAEFANSEDFSHFMENVAWFMDQITAERVEKLFTALGKAVLDVAEALMRFVGSDKFKDFMTKLFEWYDKLSVDDIAGFIRKIALAIAIFKFTAFVGKGFAGFLSFLSILTSGKGILSIAGDLLKGLAKGISGLFGEKGLGGLFKGAGKGISGALAGLIPKEGAIAKVFTAIGSAFSTVGSVILGGALITAIVTAIAFVINNWDKIAPVLSSVSEMIFKGLGMALGGLAKFIGEQISGALQTIGRYFMEQAEACGGNIILGIIVGIGRAIVNFVAGIYEYVVKPFIEGFKKGFGIHSPAETMIPIGEYLIEGMLEGIKLIISGIGGWLYEHVVQPIIDFFAGAAEWLIEGGKAIIDGIKNGIDIAKEGLAAKWDEIKEDAGKAWKRVCEDAEEWWGTIKDTVHGLAEDLRKNLEDKWNEVKQNGIDAWEQFKTDASDRWDKIRTTIHDIAKDLRRKLYERWEDVKREGARAWDSFKTTAQQKWQSIRDTIVSFAENTRATLSGIWENLKATAEGIWNGIKGSAESIWRGIKDTIVGFAQSASEEASHKFWDLVGWASDAFNGVVNAASNILGGVKGAVQGAFSDASTWLSGAGENIVKGLSNGVSGAKNLFSKALDTVTGWGSDRFTSSAYGWGIHSPSTLTTEWGEYIDEGLVNGIEGNAGRVADSMQYMAVNAQQAFLDNQGDYYVIGTEQMNSFANAITSQIGNISNAMNAIGAKTMDAFRSAFYGIEDIGSDVMGGLVNGLRNGMASVSRVLQGIVAEIKYTFCNLLDIHSPSKVFEKYGNFIIDGLANGIEDSEKESRKALEDVYKGLSKVKMPKFDLDAAVPKSSLKMDSYQHTDFTGTATFDQGAMQASMRSAIQESIGSLILPYLNDIANSSRETANKNLTISAKDVHTAVRVEDKRFKTQTGRSAFAY